jgi:hypothetical protein
MRRSLFAFVLGAATGYVLGARAGRERYEQLLEAGRMATATGRVTAGVAKTAANATSGAVTLGRKAVAKVRGDREIVLPDGPVISIEVTPPSTL